MTTHKVIDIAVPGYGGSDGVFAGTNEECHAWVGAKFGYQIVPLSLHEIQWYKLYTQTTFQKNFQA